MVPILTWQVKSVKYTHRLSHLPAKKCPALYVGEPLSVHPPLKGEDECLRCWSDNFCHLPDLKTITAPNNQPLLIRALSDKTF